MACLFVSLRIELLYEKYFTGFTEQGEGVMKSRRNEVIICFLIGICFLWTGSGYLTWMYQLLDYYPSATVDLLTEVVGYLFQIMGLILFSAYRKRRTESSGSKKGFLLLMLADLCLIVLSAFAWNRVMSLVFGYSMNLLHGAVAGFYLTKLVTHVSQQHRGRVFGLGYGMGSIGSWMISLIGNGNFLQSPYVLIFYALFVGLSVVLAIKIDEEDGFDIGYMEAGEAKLSKKLVLLAIFTLILLSTVKSVGFYFPTADLSSGNIRLEFTRIFYASGLIAAGFIADRNRKYGAVCCIAALVFPFALLVLKADVGTSIFLWITGYVFFGFFVVYRVIVFADFAGKCESCLYLAGFGLLFGRLGDVAGTTIGIFLENRLSLLVILAAVLFIGTIFLFFMFYQKMYFPILSEEKNAELLLEDFSQQYGLSPREKEVFSLIKEGRSNSEIAGDLYISENTVKFHMKNILRKTECSNRTELITLFKG